MYFQRSTSAVAPRKTFERGLQIFIINKNKNPGMKVEDCKILSKSKRPKETF